MQTMDLLFVFVYVAALIMHYQFFSFILILLSNQKNEGIVNFLIISAKFLCLKIKYYNQLLFIAAIVIIIL